MSYHFKIGTRNSKLAMWQAEMVKDQLEKAGATVDLVSMETKGDKILDVKLSKIGSKGVFTEELEYLLKNEEVDIAVHSAKDMPSKLDDGLELISFSARELVNDVLISRKDVSLEGESIVIGTSSTRRVALLRNYYPQHHIVDMRGNLQTRVRKMDEGQCDAMILAYAGVHRMGYHDIIKQKLDLEKITPPVGQGSVTIEAYVPAWPKEKIDFVRNACNHETTEICLLAERAFLKKMEGGCSVPVFCLANLHEDKISMKAGIISLDGSRLLEYKDEDLVNRGAVLGQQLAEKILENGGREMMKEIRQELDQKL